jgi:hypothetical protein
MRRTFFMGRLHRAMAARTDLDAEDVTGVPGLARRVTA